MPTNVLANRVKVGTATTGTGTVTLGAASNNSFCTFAEAGVSNGQVVTYEIEEGLDFEIGRGTYTAAGTTLSRDTVLLSKIGGTAGTSKMSLGGTATVRIIASAEDFGKQGTASLDFGAFPGKRSTSLAITGQSAIQAGSIVEAWIRPAATADHTADEHLRSPPLILVGNIVAGTGFTIYARSPVPDGLYYGVWNVGWRWE
jgi:hypothetical protein